ncbi:MAG: SDR family oxidoreductase [Candidatus Krumholzibacteria bacterium]|nr:SDR family oxidoreductase [Candidatus Krumholzibacteria bacterium]
MTLVVGSTGALGFEICRRLRSEDSPVRALVRPGALREGALHRLGAEIVYGDLKDPPSLEAACRGITSVITTANAMTSRQQGDSLRSVDRDGHLSLLKAAKACGVQHFVYTSISSEASPRAVLVLVKRQIERAVRESGMTWTILQPAAFMETWFSPMAGWEVEKGRVRLVGPGTAKFNPVSLGDVASFAVLGANRSDLERRVISIGGSDVVSPLGAVRIFEEASGRKLVVKHIPVGLVAAAGVILRPFNPVLSSLLALAAGSERGDVIDMALVLSEFPVTMTSLREFAQRTANQRQTA